MGLGRETLKHTVIYSIGTVLGRLVSFLMLPFYAHIFQVQGYGIIALIDTSLGLLTILLSGGFQTGILRIYHEQNAENKNITLSTGVGLVWILGALLIIFPFIFSSYISKLIFGSAEYYSLFCLALINFLIDTAGQSASTIQIIKQQSVLFTSINLVRLVVGLMLNVWLVVFMEVGLIGVFLSSLITSIISSTAFHILAYREHGFEFSHYIAVRLLNFQLPLLPGEIVSFLGRQAERILVRILIGLEGVGILEMAYKFPPLINLFITIPFQRAWRTKSIEIAHQVNAPCIISKMFTQYFYVMVFFGLILGVTIQSILKITTPPEFWQAAAIVRIEIITTILNGTITYLSFGILYSKKTGILSNIKIAVVPIKIILSFVFILLWGLRGAAFSALLIEFIMLIWILKKAQALYRLPLEYWKIGFIIFSAFIFFFLIENGFLGKIFVSSVLEQWISQVNVLLRTNLYGNYESRKIILFLLEKKDDVITIILNTILVMPFLALFPLMRKSSLINIDS